MTAGDIIKKFPEIEAEVILAEILKVSSEMVYSNPGTKLAKTDLAKFNRLAKMRLKGKPLAYCIGYKFFFGEKFSVNKNVLIPRPETEFLVEQALKIIKNRVSKKTKKIFDIADVGTGSGCIAISIAKQLPPQTKANIKIHAFDVSSEALKVAKKNASRLLQKNEVNFYKKNLLNGLKKKFDLIIANLPYVPITDYVILRDGLKFEPKLALTDESDNYILLQQFISHVKKNLKPKAKIILEIDPASAPFIKSAVKKFLPGKKITFSKDLNNLIRYAFIK